MRVPHHIRLLLFVLALSPTLVFAQDITAEPNYGALSLEEGFYPDPQVVDVTSGGSISVNIPDCAFGYVSNAPDVDLYYDTSGNSDLFFYVEGAGDTTLLINTPSGDWVCDDDSGPGTNPSIQMRYAQSGLYNVWVGSYSDEYTTASLYISEIDTVQRPDLDGGVPDFSLQPTYGTISLDEGFLPDPHTVTLSAGGSVELDMGECTYGYVAEAPDVDMQYSTSGDSNLYIYVESNDDTTLLVNTANGDWICNDDGYYGTNPIIVLPYADGGLYNIWVGSFGGNISDARVHISEIDPR